LASFTGGRVAMIQYGSLGYDGDYACGLLNTPLTTSVSVPAGDLHQPNRLHQQRRYVTYVQTGAARVVRQRQWTRTTSGTLARNVRRDGTTSDPNDDTGTSL